MPSIQFQSLSIDLREKESVLDALLRNDIPVSHSCRAGSCGSCLMRAVEGVVPARAQAGLKESWKARGYFLPCVCTPDSDLTIDAVDAESRVPATITQVEGLSPTILKVRLRTEAPFEYRAGQYVSIVREDGLARSYSIASLPDEQELEFHVRLIAGGRMSSWLAGAQLGTRVQLIGPSGECFYVHGRPDQPMVLIGTGTGLAPLYGIARDALQGGHRAPIQLFHGAVRPDGLYLRNELSRLSGMHSNFTYTPTVLEGDGSDTIALGPIGQVVAKQFSKLHGWRGFVCGDPALVHSLKKQIFLSGIASRDIHADAFLPSMS